MLKRKNCVDILITDIEMSGISGIDLANRVREQDERIIIFFVTRHETYARRCFDADPLNFWSKPVSYDVVEKDFKRAYKRLAREPKYVTFPSNHRKEVLLCDEVVYIDVSRKRTFVHTKYSAFKTKKSLSEFQKELTSCDLVRIHQSYIVNLKYIETLENDFLTLSDVPVRFPVGRTYRDSFRDGILLHKLRRTGI